MHTAHQFRRMVFLSLGLTCIAVAALVLVDNSQAQPRTATRKAGEPEAKQPAAPIKTSYDQIAPVLQGKETFQAVMAKDKADKPAVMARQQKLLDERYDLTARPDK